MSWYLALRWLHVFAAAAWFGEVVTINFVLVPAVSRLSSQDGSRFLVDIFPRIFRMASYLSATAVLTGLVLAWFRYSADLSTLWSTGSGRAFLVGATLGLLLTTFHFILEPRLDGMICTAAESGDLELSDRVISLLRIVPRVGLLVIGSTLLLMMIASRGT